MRCGCAAAAGRPRLRSGQESKKCRQPLGSSSQLRSMPARVKLNKWDAVVYISGTSNAEFRASTDDVSARVDFQSVRRPAPTACRILDIMFALAGLLFVAPLMIVVAIAIKSRMAARSFSATRASATKAEASAAGNFARWPWTPRRAWPRCWPAHRRPGANGRPIKSCVTIRASPCSADPPGSPRSTSFRSSSTCCAGR